MKHTTIPPMNNTGDAGFAGAAKRYHCDKNIAIVGTYDVHETIYLACSEPDRLNGGHRSIGVRLAKEDAVRYCATIMQRIGVCAITVGAVPANVPVTYEEG